ncbi:FecCD family ABC transporter permease [Paramicrobacterium chengjingii]|uniref:FecCD family ABC transporter permease n=1 Tax=Paramicrobacterium chengjingii TaxID=2769067 RepID=UPI001F1834DD|nr:iron ABC transporter permease [Microbacterium chengjingii]
MRRAPTILGITTGAAALAAAVFLSIGIGPIAINPITTFHVIATQMSGTADAVDQLSRTVVIDLRMPRILFGALAGAALAVSGASLQSLFRNPLADPGIIGVSGGASAGAVTAIVLLPPLGATALGWLIPAAAFAGGLLATALIYFLARPGRSTGTARLLLVGIAIGSGFAAITGFFTFAADDDELETIVFWQMGSLGSIDWAKLALATPALIVGIAIMISLHRRLDMLSLGERQAQHLGLNVMATRGLVITITALLTGATVAFAGTIGFIGLVVPHIVRMAFGPRHRAVLPISAVTGGLLIVIADTLSRTIAPPSEVPIGLFTALLGAPFFLWLVINSKQVKM